MTSLLGSNQDELWDTRAEFWVSFPTLTDMANTISSNDIANTINEVALTLECVPVFLFSWEEGEGGGGRKLRELHFNLVGTII